LLETARRGEGMCSYQGHSRCVTCFAGRLFGTTTIIAADGHAERAPQEGGSAWGARAMMSEGMFRSLHFITHWRSADLSIYSDWARRSRRCAAREYPDAHHPFPPASVSFPSVLRPNCGPRQHPTASRCAERGASSWRGARRTEGFNKIIPSRHHLYK
jgi:hypothetical protein